MRGLHCVSHESRTTESTSPALCRPARGGGRRRAAPPLPVATFTRVSAPFAHVNWRLARPARRTHTAPPPPSLSAYTRLGDGGATRERDRRLAAPAGPPPGSASVSLSAGRRPPDAPHVPGPPVVPLVCRPRNRVPPGHRGDLVEAFPLAAARGAPPPQPASLPSETGLVMPPFPRAGRGFKAVPEKCRLASSPALDVGSPLEPDAVAEFGFQRVTLPLVKWCLAHAQLSHRLRASRGKRWAVRRRGCLGRRRPSRHFHQNALLYLENATALAPEVGRSGRLQPPIDGTPPPGMTRSLTSRAGPGGPGRARDAESRRR
jgi:hypothetical protein